MKEISEISGSSSENERLSEIDSKSIGNKSRWTRRQETMDKISTGKLSMVFGAQTPGNKRNRNAFRQVQWKIRYEVPHLGSKPDSAWNDFKTCHPISQNLQASFRTYWSNKSESGHDELLLIVVVEKWKKVRWGPKSPTKGCQAMRPKLNAWDQATMQPFRTWRPSTPNSTPLRSW